MGILQQLVDEGHVRESAENDDKELLDWLSRKGSLLCVAGQFRQVPIAINGDARAAIRWAMRETNGRAD